MNAVVSYEEKDVVEYNGGGDLPHKLWSSRGGRVEELARMYEVENK